MAKDKDDKIDIDKKIMKDFGDVLTSGQNLVDAGSFVIPVSPQINLGLGGRNTRG